MSVIERCPLLGSNLKKIVTFGNKCFVSYSWHVRYLGCPLLRSFTVCQRHMQNQVRHICWSFLQEQWMAENPLRIFSKSSILDVLLSFENASVAHICWKSSYAPLSTNTTTVFASHVCLHQKVSYCSPIAFDCIKWVSSYSNKFG